MIKIFIFKFRKKDAYPGSISIVIPTPSIDSSNFKKCLSNIYNSRIPENTTIIASVSSGKDFNLSKSVNSGIEVSNKNDDIVLLNDDCFVGPTTIEKLMQGKTETGGIYGSVLKLPDGTPQHMGGFAIVGKRQYLKWGLRIGAPLYALRQINFFKEHKLGIFEPYHKKNNPIEKPLYVTGALVLIPRETINKVGVFDENFKNGYEDLDYCLSVWKAGFTVKLVRDSIAIHKNHDSLGPNKENVVQNIRYLENKWSYDFLKEVATEHSESNS